MPQMEKTIAMALMGEHGALRQLAMLDQDIAAAIMASSNITPVI